MTTLARTYSESSAHWYSRSGEPCYEVIGKSTGRPRPTTIRDARENGWLPSTTTILRSLSRPELESWKMEMACLAILTAPRKDGEPLDAFVQRVLHEERQQDQEAAAARDLGTRIHAAIEQALNGEQYDTGLREYVELSFQEILRTGGALMQTEKIVVGDRYAGKLDALTQHDGLITIWDIKSCRNLPKYGSYIEAKLQLASYAQALGNTGDARIQTANLYVSTSEPGQIKVDTHQDWQETYERGFRPLVDYFYWANDL